MLYVCKLLEGRTEEDIIIFLMAEGTFGRAGKSLLCSIYIIFFYLYIMCLYQDLIHVNGGGHRWELETSLVQTWLEAFVASLSHVSCNEQHSKKEREGKRKEEEQAGKRWHMSGDEERRDKYMMKVLKVGVSKLFPRCPASSPSLHWK